MEASYSTLRTSLRSQWVVNKRALRWWLDVVCKKWHDLASMVECLVEELAAAGLYLNTSKAKILTTESLKEPMFLAIGGDRIEVLRGEQNHTYVGKWLPGHLRKMAMVDIQHRTQIAWMKSNEHRDTLLTRHVSLRLRLKPFWFRHHSYNYIWPYDLSFDFESISETWSGEKPVCFLQLLDGHPWWTMIGMHWCKKWTKKAENAQQIFSVRPWTENCWLENFALQRRLHLQWIPGPLGRMNGIPTKGGRWIIVWNLADELVAQRNAGMIILNFLHRKCSIHHGFGCGIQSDETFSLLPPQDRGKLLHYGLCDSCWLTGLWILLMMKGSSEGHSSR